MKRFLIFILVIASFSSYAQPNLPPPPEVPIDQGVIYLLISALSLGLYKLNAIKNKK